MIRCEFCGEPVTPDRPGTFQFTAGWVEARVDGGGHAIALPERQARWAHKVCISMIKAKISPGQGTLL